MGNSDLLFGDRIFVAIDERPHRAGGQRELRREDAVPERGRVRFPIGAHQVGGEAALNRRDTAQRFGVTRRDPVPDAPDIFPTHVADAVEEGELQVVGFVARPAVADVDHVAGLQPFLFGHRRREGEAEIAPVHVVPHQAFIRFGRAFGLEGHGMAGFVRRGAVGTGDAGEGVAVHAIGADFGHQLRGGGPVGHAGVARAGVPRHGRKEHAHAAAVEVFHHLAQRRHAARHVASEVPLAAVVDPDIGIDGPEEHAIDAAITLVEIVQEAIDRVDAALGIVKIAVLHHGLGRDEIFLRPEEFRATVFGVIVSHADQALVAPLLEVGQPGGKFRIAIGAELHQAGDPLRLRRHLAGAGNLVALRRVAGVLRRRRREQQKSEEERARDHGRSFIYARFPHI